MTRFVSEQPRAPPPLVEAQLFTTADDSNDANDVHLLRGPLRYYHYGCDGFNDQGWGCGYRSVQSIMSWLRPNVTPPSIEAMQANLGRANGSAAAVGATAWIGVADAVILLDEWAEASVEVIPLRSGDEVALHMPRLAAHFDGGGGPLMIGGGNDVYSKTVVGVRGGVELLILDPHYFSLRADGFGAASVSSEEGVASLSAGGWTAWKPLSILSPASFYNIALPRPCTDHSAPLRAERSAHTVALLGSRDDSSWAGEFEVVKEGDATSAGRS